MKGIAERRPYWRYRHSDASEHPRPEHVAWDGLVLRHDDPWWDTHATPNGWGCKCFIEALNERDLGRLGKSGPDEAPGVNMRSVTVGERGPSPRTVEVPEGVDPGWAYAPGQAATAEASVREALEGSARRAAEVAARGAEAMLARDSSLEALSGAWRRWRGEEGGQGRQAEAFTLGVMRPGVMRWLRAEKGIEVDNAAITVSRRELSHAARADKARRGAALGEDDLDRLPEAVARPEAVLYDSEGGGELLYVFPRAGGGGKGKVVARVNYTAKIALDGEPRRGVTTNSVRTAGYVQSADLRDPRYEAIMGAVK